MVVISLLLGSYRSLHYLALSAHRLHVGGYIVICRFCSFTQMFSGFLKNAMLPPLDSNPFLSLQLSQHILFITEGRCIKNQRRRNVNHMKHNLLRTLLAKIDEPSRPTCNFWQLRCNDGSNDKGTKLYILKLIHFFCFPSTTCL